MREDPTGIPRRQTGWRTTVVCCLFLARCGSNAAPAGDTGPADQARLQDSVGETAPGDATAPEPELAGPDGAAETEGRGDVADAPDVVIRDGMVALTLSADGVLTQDVLLGGPGGVHLQLPAGTAVLPGDESALDGAVELRIEAGPAAQAPQVSEATVIQHVRVSLRVAGQERPCLFVAASEQGAAPLLRFPPHAALPAESVSSLYGLEEEPGLFKSLGEWVFLTRGSALSNGTPFRPLGTGQYAQVLHGDAESAPLPIGWELIAPSDQPVFMVKVVERDTAEYLGSSFFEPGDLGPHAVGPPDETIWLWLEPAGRGQVVHVRSNYGNLPVIYAAPYDGPFRPLEVRGPYLVDGTATDTVLEHPYLDREQPYLGALHILVNADHGGFSDLRRDVLLPLRAQGGEVRFVGLDFFRRTAQGYVAMVRVGTHESGLSYVRSHRFQSYTPVLERVTAREVLSRRMVVAISEVWTDPSSGLTWWADCAQDVDHPGAVAFCEALDAGGFGDWRLPTISELRTLFLGCPALETGGECGITDDCLDYALCRDGIACGSRTCNCMGRCMVDELYGVVYACAAGGSEHFASASPAVDPYGSSSSHYYADYGYHEIDAAPDVRDVSALCVRR